MKEKKGTTPARWFVGGLLGAVSSITLAFLLLIPCALLLLGHGGKSVEENLLVGICVFLGGGIGGWISEKWSRGGALMSGVLTAILSFVLLCLIGLAGWQTLSFTDAGFIGGCLGVGSVAGAVFGTIRLSKKLQKRKIKSRCSR